MCTRPRKKALAKQRTIKTSKWRSNDESDKHNHALNSLQLFLPLSLSPIYANITQEWGKTFLFDFFYLRKGIKALLFGFSSLLSNQISWAALSQLFLFFATFTQLFESLEHFFSYLHCLLYKRGHMCVNCSHTRALIVLATRKKNEDWRWNSAICFRMNFWLEVWFPRKK